MGLENPIGPLLPQITTQRRGIRTTSAQACGLYLAVGAPTMDHRGVIIGRERYSGKAFVFDPFVLYAPESRVRLPSPHWLVLGKSGHGKSALTKCYVLRQLRYRDRSFVVLDAQGEGSVGEWDAIAKAYGVTPIRLAYGEQDGRGIRINPLDPAIPTAHQEAVLVSQIEILVSGELNADAKFAVSVALAAAKKVATEQERVPLLSDVLTALTAPSPAQLGERVCTAQELSDWGLQAAFALNRLVHGDLAGLFDGPTTEGIDLSSRLIVFDMSRLPREGPSMPLFMAVIGPWLRFGWLSPDDNVKRTLICEEAWHILSHRPVARLFNELIRYGRRLGLGFIAVVHHLSDALLKDIPEAESIIKLTATRIVYHIQGDDADATADYLALPRWARDAIKDSANLCAPGNAVWSFAGATMLVEHLRTAAERTLTDTDARMIDTAVAVDDEASVPFAWAEGASV
ncbi:MAG TPA: ATP/GTP-binding protein [Actinospica sp.]|jgi:type IV secretory pathway VirB4 component|nr:ATP/GTP-binding protein [Actinospica sp.]